NPDLQRINTEFLERLGYTVHVVDSSDGATQVLKDLPGIDLLFTDIHLGSERTGIDLAVEASARYPRLKIILYTGNRSLLGSSRSQWPILHKPVPLQLLARTIHETLKNPR